MLDIQRKYLQNLDATLKGMGAQYAIVIDGEKFGDLEVAVPKTRKHAAPRRDFSQFNIRTKVDAMKIGDVVTFDPADGFTAEDIRGNVTAYATYKYGKKACTSTVSNGQVQMMRVA